MFHIVIDHPPIEEEFEVVRSTTSTQNVTFERPVSGADLVAFKSSSAACPPRSRSPCATR
jgi:hypothetical protein